MNLLASPEQPTLEDFGTDVWWIVLIKVLGVFVVLVLMTLFAIVFERKLVARMQQRIGPNRTGPRGYLQSLADGDGLTVTGATGAITLPVRVTEMPDRVVWVPMRSPGSEVRSGLGTAPGGVVRLSASPARPAGGVA